MEMKVSHNTLKNLFDGMKLIKFPSLKQEPFTMEHFYQESDYERLKQDYKRSLRDIRNEVIDFEQRAKS